MVALLNSYQVPANDPYGYTAWCNAYRAWYGLGPLACRVQTYGIAWWC